MSQQLKGAWGVLRHWARLPVCLCLLGSGCAEPESASDAAGDRPAVGVSWDSPKLRSLEEEWERRSGELKGSGMSLYAGKQTIYIKLLRERLSWSEIEELIESLKTMPEEQTNRTSSQNQLLAGLFWVCVDEGQRGSLVRLIATRCPSLIGGIELCLVYGGMKHLKDPILILVDAYEASEFDAVREQIVYVLRRSFAQLPPMTGNDDLFVKRCGEWYRENRERLVLNPDSDGGGPALRDGKLIWRPLFILRNEGEDTRANGLGTERDAP